MSNNLSTQVLSTIKENNIKPIPKWFCDSKNYLKQTFLYIWLLLGSIIFSVVFGKTYHNDWHLYQKTNGDFWNFCCAHVPFMWILMFLVSIGLIHTGIRLTKKGHRYSTLRIIIAASVFTVLSGLIFAALNVNNYIVLQTEGNFLYKSTRHPRVLMWVKPEEGRLAGTVLNVNESYFLFKDFLNNEWRINYDIDRHNVEEGMKLKLIGEKNNDDIFTALDVCAWDDSYLPFH